MSGKKMEGDENQRRKRANEARKRGRSASEEGATFGASKQREHLGRKEDHAEKLRTPRKNKQPLQEPKREPRPHSRGR